MVSMMKHSISDRVGLKGLAAMLHDARFTRESMEFDERARVFVLRCWTPAWNEATYRQILWCVHWRVVPWKQFMVTFSQVSSCHVQVEENVVYYEISTLKCSEDRKEIKIVTHYAISIRLNVERLEVELEETTKTRDDWAIHSLTCRLRSGPRSTENW
ncbi:MAG: DUF2948 family protein [Planctomycetes bacterium]|nr:DUF2948 family protein [Planctomycetota bacterium]